MCRLNNSYMMLAMAQTKRIKKGGQPEGRQASCTQATNAATAEGMHISQPARSLALVGYVMVVIERFLNKNPCHVCTGNAHAVRYAGR